MAKIDFEKGKITLMNLLQFVREIRDKLLNANNSSPVEWDDIENKPTEFTPTSHTHSISEINGLDAKILDIESRLNALESTEEQ